MSYGCPALVDGSPVGGGADYRALVTPDMGDRVVSALADLHSALGAARSGDVIYLADGAVVSLASTDQMYNAAAGVGFYVPEGVTLAAGRGRPGVTPGRIEIASGFRDNDWCYLIQCGRRGCVRGLDLYGRQDGTATGYSWTGIRAGALSEIDNNEVHGFGYAGVTALPDITDVWVHHNYIHHCRGAGHGYGVEVAAVSGVLSHDDDFHVASALVEGNIIDYTRHVVANQSGLGSYTARYNYLMEHAAYESIFDIHGQNDDPPGSMAQVDGEYVYCAGDTVEIYNNTSVCGNANEFVGARGFPARGETIRVHHNWLKVLGDPCVIAQFMFRMPGWAYNAVDSKGAMASGSGYGPFVQMESSDNWYGSEAPPADPGEDPGGDGQPADPAIPGAKPGCQTWVWALVVGAALALAAMKER